MATATQRPPIGDNHSPSIGELVNRATSQFSTLVRDEASLAKMELVSKAKRAGAGAGLLGGAALFGLLGLILLLFTAVAALDRIWPLWLAALVVGLGTLFVSLVMAGLGLGRLRRASAVGSEARSGLAADLATVRSAVREGRHH